MAKTKEELKACEDHYLLILLMEECSEIIKESSKILRFGWDSKHPNKDFTNRDNLFLESQQVLDIVEELLNRDQEGELGSKW